MLLSEMVMTSKIEPDAGSSMTCWVVSTLVNRSLRLCTHWNSSIATEHAFSVTATEHGSRLIPAGRLHDLEKLTHLSNLFCENIIHQTHHKYTGKIDK